jgi:ferredoxin-NADP reductase
VERVSQAEFWNTLPRAWDSEDEESLVCCHVRDETHDVKSFFFATQGKHGFAFRPGQFVTLELEIGGEQLNRCYTISSSPTRPHTISITVKRVPGGMVSNWLHDNLKVGDAVRMLGPAGEFSCACDGKNGNAHDEPARQYLFLSAGSGVTPLMSMTRAHHELAEDRDIVFVHSARTPADIIFARELELIAFNQRHFRTVFVVERLGETRDWPGLTGFLTLPMLRLIAADFMEREIFTCGPAPYMAAVRTMLHDAGFDSTHYHEESFSFEQLAQMEDATLEAVTAGAPEVAGYAVRFLQSRRELRCQPGQHVLEAAQQAGLRLPKSCSQGMCGTCKVKLVSGRVEMNHQGGIRQREIDQGMVLLCCSKPLTDLVIEK